MKLKLAGPEASPLTFQRDQQFFYVGGVFLNDALPTA